VTLVSVSLFALDLFWRFQRAFNLKFYTSHVTRHTSHVTRHTSHVTRHSLLTCPASSHMFRLFEVPYRALRSFHSSCVRLQVVPSIFFTFTFDSKRYQNRKRFWLRPPRSSRTSSIARCASSILHTCARPAAARADCDGDSVEPCVSKRRKRSSGGAEAQRTNASNAHLTARYAR